MPRSARSHVAFFHFLAWLFPCAVLLLIEAVLRLFPIWSPLAAIVPAEKANLVDGSKVTIFDADPVLCWKLRPNLRQVTWDYTVVTTNSQGYRMDQPVGPKSPTGFRVVCIGDSVTFGYRVPTVFAATPHQWDPGDKPYPALIQDALRRVNPGRTIDVVPMAVPGYTSHQGLLWARRDLAALRPDVVTLCFGWNDTCRRPRTDRVSMPEGGLTVLMRGLIIDSQLMTRLVALAQGVRGPAGGGGASGVERVDTAEFVENMLGMAHLATQDGAVPLIVGTVYQNSKDNPVQAASIEQHRAALKTAARQDHVPYLEIPELMETSYPANLWLFGEPIHPDAIGHRLMAARILHDLTPVLTRAGLNPPLMAEPAIPTPPPALR